MENNNYILDTCVFFWAMFSPEKIPLKVRKLILSPNSKIFISSISIWELILKQKNDPSPNFTEITELRKRHNFDSLELSESDLHFLENLPPIHKDPFDRILISQSLHRNFILITPDELIQKYPVKTIW